VIMYEEFSDGSRQTYTALGGGLAEDIPLVVLVNDGSASASEILAGAIQDHERGKLVGTVTYGKGSVQNWVVLQNDQGAVRITIARWLTPTERQISGIGLTPDFIVEFSEEDIENNRDVQLEKALELLGASLEPAP
jgi:carboxyl-terminal processing protease